MPYCGRVDGVLARSSASGWQLAVTVRSEHIRDRMINVLRAATAASVSVHPLSDPSELLIRSVDGSGLDSTHALLDLLSQHVTIDDHTSCSHALNVHTLFPPEGDASEGVKTYVGEVVSDAKYTWGRQQQEAQAHLAELMSDFISVHPLLRQATHVTCPPGSQGGINTSGLAFNLAQNLAERHNLNSVSIKGTPRRSRKSNRNSADCSDVAGTFEALDSVAGASVLVVDDLCGHACTINEAVRALRVARVRHVFALSGSKDASGCQGLSPHTDKWIDWHPPGLDLAFE